MFIKEIPRVSNLGTIDSVGRMMAVVGILCTAWYLPAPLDSRCQEHLHIPFSIVTTKYFSRHQISPEGQNLPVENQCGLN